MAQYVIDRGIFADPVNGKQYVLGRGVVQAAAVTWTDTDREKLAFMEWDQVWEPGLPIGAV